MEKALEILKNPIIIISANENHVYSKKQIDEAIVELEEVMKPKTCEGCKNYSNDNSHKAWECVKAHKFVMCGHAFEPPKDFYCNLFEPKDNA